MQDNNIKTWKNFLRNNLDIIKNLAESTDAYPIFIDSLRIICGYTTASKDNEFEQAVSYVQELISFSRNITEIKKIPLTYQEVENKPFTDILSQETLEQFEKVARQAIQTSGVIPDDGFYIRQQQLQETQKNKIIVKLFQQSKDFIKPFSFQERFLFTKKGNEYYLYSIGSKEVFQSIKQQEVQLSRYLEILEGNSSNYMDDETLQSISEYVAEMVEENIKEYNNPQSIQIDNIQNNLRLLKMPIILKVENKNWKTEISLYTLEKNKLKEINDIQLTQTLLRAYDAYLLNTNFLFLDNNPVEFKGGDDYLYSSGFILIDDKAEFNYNFNQPHKPLYSDEPYYLAYNKKFPENKFHIPGLEYKYYFTEQKNAQRDYKTFLDIMENPKKYRVSFQNYNLSSMKENFKEDARSRKAVSTIIKDLLYPNINTDQISNATNGITKNIIEKIMKWSTGNKKMIFFDWDQTLSVLPGLNPFYFNIPNYLTFVLGGPERLHSLKSMFVHLHDNNVKVFILTQNSIASRKNEFRQEFINLIRQFLDKKFKQENLVYAKDFYRSSKVLFIQNEYEKFITSP